MFPVIRDKLKSDAKFIAQESRSFIKAAQAHPYMTASVVIGVVGLLAIVGTILGLHFTVGLDRFGAILNSKVIQPIGYGLNYGDTFKVWYGVITGVALLTLFSASIVAMQYRKKEKPKIERVVVEGQPDDDSNVKSVSTKEYARQRRVAEMLVEGDDSYISFPFPDVNPSHIEDSDKDTVSVDELTDDETSSGYESESDEVSSESDLPPYSEQTLD